LYKKIGKKNKSNSLALPQSGQSAKRPDLAPRGQYEMFRRVVTFPLNYAVRKPLIRNSSNVKQNVSALIMNIEHLDKENTVKLTRIRIKFKKWRLI
jgi:hypothetical protein